MQYIFLMFLNMIQFSPDRRQALIDSCFCWLVCNCPLETPGIASVISYYQFPNRREVEGKQHTPRVRQDSTRKEISPFLDVSEWTWVPFLVFGFSVMVLASSPCSGRKTALFCLSAGTDVLNVQGWRWISFSPERIFWFLRKHRVFSFCWVFLEKLVNLRNRFKVTGFKWGL